MLSGNLPRNEPTARAFASTAVNGVWGVFCFAICKSACNRKMWKWGKAFLPIRCKQQTLLPVAVKISGTTWMCFFVSKNKANGRSDVKRKFAEKRTHGKASCTSPVVNSVLSVSDFAVCKKVGNRKMWKWGKRLVANPLQTTDTVACCRKNFRHNLNVFFVSKKQSQRTFRC